MREELVKSTVSLNNDTEPISETFHVRKRQEPSIVNSTRYFFWRGHPRLTVALTSKSLDKSRGVREKRVALSGRQES